SVRFDVVNPSNIGDTVHGTTILVPLMSRITGELMDRFEGLRLIQQWGAVLEGVDINAATARGIAVGNIPTTTSGNANSVAEWCVMAALAMSRQLLDHNLLMREGTRWGSPIGQALYGRRAGIIGLGGIGNVLARRLGAFEMDVQAVTRSPDAASAAASGVRGVRGMESLGELLAESDYLFLTLPLTPETRHLIGENALAAMKPGAYLINAGRGGLVDPGALIAALDRGQLGGAALDVFEQEPLDPASPLLTHPRILVSPHVAGVTDIFYRSAASVFVDALDAIAGGRPLTHCVNWSAVAKHFYAEP
ncbi:MAG TPA: NAD(P)-dependent oxidoreductase, partial [Thermomicrobiales bacterium]|nr:NAD(P)-dependent oxidoreductase [Thermomicrobiales bacterium]